MYQFLSSFQQRSEVGLSLLFCAEEKESLSLRLREVKKIVQGHIASR